MRKLSLSLAMLATTAITAPAVAEEQLPIVEKPLQLTIHMHWPRAQGYGVGGDASKVYPVEKKACELTNICLKDATAGKNSTDAAEAMNLLLAAGGLYLLGVQVLTVRVHLPLNAAVQKLDLDRMDAADLESARLAFEPRWNRWNRIRTASAVLSTALMILVFWMM